MRALELGNPRRGGELRILAVGAHCDDIDIGCGAAMLNMLQKYRGAQVTWVVFASDPQRERELRASARKFLRGAGRATVIVHRFRDGFFPAQFSDIKESFESLKRLADPDIVFTHHRFDRHQDHRLIAELTWNTFRNHLILEYEIPKYEGDLTTPCAYVPVTRVQAERKIRILCESYPTQRSKSWFTEDTFRGVLRLRGLESGSETGWAEGFHVTKFQLG